MSSEPFICCDLEGTCWDSGPLQPVQRKETEIIEIGAVRMDRDRTIIDEFQTFVRPQRHAELSTFCTDLTGITQADVDAAPPLPEAMAGFAAWIGNPDSVLVSWGAFDRNQIRRDCRRWDGIYVRKQKWLAAAAARLSLDDSRGWLRPTSCDHELDSAGATTS